MTAFKILAHRGGARTSLENTVQAMELAARLGAGGVECDVQLSVDGEPVIFHDHETFRLTQVRGRIDRLPWSKIRTLRVEDKAPIPHLKDVLDWLAGWPHLQLYLDLRVPSQRLLEILAASLSGSGLKTRVFLLTFWSRRKYLRDAKRLDPQLQVALMPQTPWSLVERARGVAAKSLCLGWDDRWWTKSLFKTACLFADLPKEARAARSAGIGVSGGIANTVDDVAWLRRRGISEIWTDDVPLALSALKKTEASPE
ncbi:MAG: glycerophosphodiester phosphodiesterase [Elusimicrobia bacterium]|nr:glycerophosphodiester phosphodiesterase [Elusimicrobiota bacterium]